jgi:CHAT domain-containing protein/Tfp pilus assembly protein PilF
VARFRALSPPDRRANAAADSVLQIGSAALKRSEFDAAMPPLRESLRRYEALADTAGIAVALNAVGVTFHRKHEPDSAEAYLRRSQNLAERLVDSRTLAKDAHDLGSVYWRRGEDRGTSESVARDRDLQRAGESFTRAREIFERIGDTTALRKEYNSFGLVAWTRGDLAEARRAFETGLAASRSAGDSTNAALFLSNLGGVALEQGDYAETDDHLRESLAIYRALGDQLNTAQQLRELGVLEQRRGDYQAALAAFSEAARMAQRFGSLPYGGLIDPWVLLAQTRTLMGDLQGARTELDRAEAFARRQGGARATQALTDLAFQRGHLALQLNRLAEAERQYARALRLGADSADVAEASVGLMWRRGNYRSARIALERQLARGSLDPHNAAQLRALVGEADWLLGDTAAARRALREALDTLRSVGAAVDEARAWRRLGGLEAQAGHSLAAESLFQRGLARLSARPAPEVAWELHAGLAGALRRRGALADAAGELRAAIEGIERVSGSLPVEEQRAAFRADKWETYVALALVEQARGRTEAAFEASERLRERQMLDLLARGRVAGGKAAPELASREQDLRRRVAELTQQLQSSPDSAPALRDPAAAAGTAGGALARAQEAYSTLLVEMREANPAYAALVHGEVAPARDVMSALGPDEALLEYLTGDSTTVVFIVTRDTMEALDLGVNHSTLAAQVDFARSALARSTEAVARPGWRPALRRLYLQLVAPVETTGLLAGKRRLLIAPHAELHYLPFAALVGPGPPEQLLLERYLLEYVPSASVWLRLRERPQGTAGSGVLAFAPRTTALPGSQAEVAAIGRIYGTRARVLVDPLATEQTFRALAAGQGIIHLATYGVLNKNNPLFSFVELRAGGGQDGRLEVHEVFGLTLNARLLVLSACQTGVGAGALADVPPGDDWVGLVQGFLYAGASNVLATLWPVADVATARLMERFYTELAAGRSEAEALAVAQRSAARDRGTAHPFFWAGFTLVRGR